MGKADRANPFNQWRKTEGITVHECYDQFGRTIGVGDFVILEQHGPVIWRVTNTKPIMRPDVPPGLIELTMGAVTQLPVQGGMPLPGLIKVRDATEYMTPEQLQAFMNDAKPGAGGEPPKTEDSPPDTPPAPEDPPRIIVP